MASEMSSYQDGLVQLFLGFMDRIANTTASARPMHPDMLDYYNYARRRLGFGEAIIDLLDSLDLLCVAYNNAGQNTNFFRELRTSLVWEKRCDCCGQDNEEHETMDHVVLEPPIYKYGYLNGYDSAISFLTMLSNALERPAYTKVSSYPKTLVVKLPRTLRGRPFPVNPADAPSMLDLSDHINPGRKNYKPIGSVDARIEKPVSYSLSAFMTLNCKTNMFHTYHRSGADLGGEWSRFEMRQGEPSLVGKDTVPDLRKNFEVISVWVYTKYEGEVGAVHENNASSLSSSVIRNCSVSRISSPSSAGVTIPGTEDSGSQSNAACSKHSSKTTTTPAKLSSDTESRVESKEWQGVAEKAADNRKELIKLLVDNHKQTLSALEQLAQQIAQNTAQIAQIRAQQLRIQQAMLNEFATG